MTLRIGIIGAGNIFERGYAPALAVSSAVTVTAVCDLDDERAAAAAARLGGDVRTFRAAEDLLAADELDAVFVLTPTHTHVGLSIAALESGRHVLCEKPMARHAVDARRMAEVAERTGCRLMIGQTRRFDERWRAIRRQIDDGRLGDLAYLFRSEHASNGAPPGAWQWNDALSGGVLWDVGVHVAELFHWFMGDLPRSVYARTMHARPEARAGGAPDAAIATYDFGPGRHALMSVSWMHPPGWGPFYATSQFVGTRGKVDYYDRDAHPTVVVGDRIEIPHDDPLLSALGPTFREEIEHFARAIETGAPFALTLEDAIAAIDMVDAAERSARSGRPEAIRP